MLESSATVLSLGASSCHDATTSTHQVCDWSSEKSDAITLVKRALKDDLLVVHYQPKVDLSNNSLAGIEALVRILDDAQPFGVAPPDSFIPFVEDTPLINEIGFKVLSLVLNDLSRWALLGVFLTVSVNVTAHQLQDLNFSGKLQSLIKLSPGVIPEQLVLELVESSRLVSLSAAFSTLHALRAVGIQSHLDDFGTGYASFFYLKALPFTAFKIDRSFVRSMLTEPKDEAIVLACVAIARAFNVGVIAEGVDSPELAQKLHLIGCSVIQGFWIAKPMPFDDLDRWLKIDGLRFCGALERQTLQSMRMR